MGVYDNLNSLTDILPKIKYTFNGGKSDRTT